MGEFADYALEEIYDEDEARFDFRRGFITIEEAYQRGIVDDLGYEFGHQVIQFRTCRCCGKTGLRWGKSGDKWRLFDGPNIHMCPENPLNEI